MRQTESLNLSSVAPTVAHLRQVSIRTGVDRFSLVRPASDGRSAAIAVIFFTQKANRDIAPFLHDLSVKVAVHGRESHTRREFSIATPLLEIVDAVEIDGQQFGWAEWNLPDKGWARVAIFVGPVVDHALAAELTTRGVITNLD